MTLPLVVVEAGPLAVADARLELAAVGWSVVEDLVAQGPADGLVLVQSLITRADAARAVLAAVEGSGLLVDAGGAERELIDSLCDDLRRLGHLDHRVARDRTVLATDAHALLLLLCGGHSLGEAAEALHLSRRSADRRLAAAREALGADTTAAAVAAYRRRLDRLPRPGERAARDAVDR